MVFGVRSIRVFTHFSLDPYYEPLPWFMIRASNYRDSTHYRDSLGLFMNKIVDRLNTLQHFIGQLLVGLI